MPKNIQHKITKNYKVKQITKEQMVYDKTKNKTKITRKQRLLRRDS